MADTHRLTSGRDMISGAALLRVATAFALLLAWELIARSGLLYRDVVPSLGAILDGLGRLLTNPALLLHARVTLFELAAAMTIGTGIGIVCGLGLGANRLAGRIFEPPIYYLGPTPKVIFLPVLIMLFGIGSGSKIAMGTMSAFFPVVLSIATGMRGIDPVLLRVGRMLRMNPWQMSTKVYLPAMKYPLVNALRLAFGICTIGVLLAETKFAREGLGYMVTQYYQRFDMPSLYALTVLIFGFAITMNWLIGKMEGAPR